MLLNYRIFPKKPPQEDKDSFFLLGRYERIKYVKRAYKLIPTHYSKYKHQNAKIWSGKVIKNTETPLDDDLHPKSPLFVVLDVMAYRAYRYLNTTENY